MGAPSFCRAARPVRLIRNRSAMDRSVYLRIAERQEKAAEASPFTRLASLWQAGLARAFGLA